MVETNRSNETITVEEVVYVKEKIKHFDREGSEYWAETNIPDIIEKKVNIVRVTYFCEQCNETKTEDLQTPEQP
jgi:ribosomal protein L24